MRGRIAAGIALVTAFAATAAATAGDNDSGFKTSAAAMLKGVNGSSTTPIISVGDVVGDYTFESIPDGISIAEVNGRGTADIVVNHELSLVPFPATRQDATNSILSRLRLNQHSAGVLRGSYAITTDAGYQRFCSNFAVGEAQGFDRDLVLTSEEARDIVLRQADAWHQPSVALSEPGAEQAGVMVAYDVKSGAHKSIYGMGRANHENGVGVPGYGHPVVLTGDDTFDAPSSQLYLYSASSGSAFWNDEGQLYAFVSTDPVVNDYGDLTTASPSVTGHFIEVPTEIATGKKDGHEVTTADFPAEGFPSPPAGVPNGPQWVLEAWSNKNNVFQFIRIEDIAYDRTDSKTVYFADTGEPRAIPGPAPANMLARGPSGTQGAYMNGRLFRLQLNGLNPLGTATLSILPGANFDANGYNNAASPHQPDNVETTKDAILFTEDPGGHNAQPAFAGATNARVWRYDLATHDLDVVAEVDQSVPGSPVTNRGNWESSGILDASTLFGPGSFLIDVQAHGWDMDAGTGNDAPAVPKRERGQLLLLNVPDS